jgi:glycosyltransferase involved in cell wall biosynthesis
MPVISIIVPVYNVEKYVRRCLDSILAQTFTDYECILVDDGSPDNCPAICDEYAAKDKRFIAIHQENAGVSAARNAGLGIAKGEWIGFVDSDDWCDTGMFQFLYENAIKHNADVSICGIRYIRDGNTIIKKNKVSDLILDSKNAILKLFDPNYYGGFPFNKIIRTTYINKYNICYDKNLRFFEDGFFFFNIFKHINSVIYSSTPYYYYFQHTQSVTNRFRKEGISDQDKETLYKFEEMISLENDREIRYKLLAAEALIAVYLCRNCIFAETFNNKNYIYLFDIIKKNERFLLHDNIRRTTTIIKLCLIRFPRFLRFLQKIRRLLVT